MVALSVTRASDPRLNAITPFGLQRGSETELILQGDRLGDAEQLLLYRPGITVKKIEKVDAKRIKATLSAAPDSPMGFHAVRVRTATGISNLKTFSVGAMPEVQETEPNNDFASPQSVPFSCTVNGVIQNEDEDFFVVEAKKGQRISVEVEGVRLGNTTFFDPYVAILNTDRFELARSDDVALLRQDCFCAIVAPEDGKYVVQIRESSYGGNGNCKYRLHIGPYPRPLAVFPAGGKPGQPLNVTWIGDVTGDREAQVLLPTDGGSDYGLLAEDESGIAPSANMVRINDLENVLESEPNDTRDKSTVATAPSALNGIIDRPGDVDYFKFTAKKGQVFDVRVYARSPLRSPLDSVLSVLRANGSGVANNDDSGGPDSYVRITAPEDGDYHILVRDHLNDGGPSFVYRVEITAVTPRLTLSLPERVQYLPVTAPVPRGNRMAFMLNAARQDFGGELKIALDGLPAGIEVTPLTMAGNLSSIPVLLTAKPDAPLAGALASVTGRPSDEKLALTGNLAQRTMLVRGQNNRDVWGHDADRMAVAVTEAAPFTIEIVQPKVPIVRNGSMQLKVIAKRNEGYSEAISIFLLYNPPGIGSSRSISIPAGQNEAVIPLTANGSAQIGNWPLIALARAKVGDGNLEMASQQANLEIADSFFNLKFEKSAAELGQDADVLVRIEKKRDFEGDATIQLLGLPAKTTTAAEPKPINQDTTEVSFKVSVAADARPGKFQTLVCRAIVTQHGEPITHTLGTGELRIDKPLPPKADAPQPAPKPKAEAKPEPAPEKRLSRLEQLRLERMKNKKEGGTP
jgi:hypothetical protein